MLTRVNVRRVTGGPVEVSSIGYNVDLILGAAGDALALFRLMTIDRADAPVRAMPDRAVVVPPAKK